MLLNDKTALITGANGGIGRAIIEKFASEGCNIIAHMRNEKKDFADFSKTVMEKYNVNIECIYFDLTDNDEIKNGFKVLAKEKKKIDILINNAGVAHGGLLQMTAIKEVREVFEVNFFAAMQMMQSVARFMLKQGGGSIVNISSISGLELAEGNCAYGTSKAALIALTKTISKEYAKMNIRVNAIAPGLTDTDMAKLMEEKAGEGMVRQTSFGRLAKPEEIADAVLYLASDKASFVTGQVLRVDGGM